MEDQPSDGAGSNHQDRPGPSADPDTRHWWGVVGLVILGWMLAQVIGTIGFAAMAGERDFEELSGTEVFWVTVPFQLAFGVIAVSIATWAGDASGLLRLREWRVTDVPIGLALGAVLQGTIGIVYSFYLDLIDQEADAASDLVDQFDGGEIVLLFITAGLMAPVVEELFYRGVFQGAAEHLAPPWLAVVVVAALFAASHFQPVELLGLFLFAATVGFVLRRTGRLTMAISTHVGFNLTSLVFLVAL